MTFMELYLAGKVSLDDIEDFIDAWHFSDSNKELHEYLGMTMEQYSSWLTSGHL